MVRSRGHASCGMRSQPRKWGADTTLGKWKLLGCFHCTGSESSASSHNLVFLSCRRCLSSRFLPSATLTGMPQVQKTVWRNALRSVPLKPWAWSARWTTFPTQNHICVHTCFLTSPAKGYQTPLVLRPWYPCEVWALGISLPTPKSSTLYPFCEMPLSFLLLFGTRAAHVWPPAILRAAPKSPVVINAPHPPLVLLLADNTSLACNKGFPGASDGKESACNAWDLGSIPGLEEKCIQLERFYQFT